MAKARGLVEINWEACKGCKLCVNACPFEVLQLSENVNGKGYHPSTMINPASCTGCASCAMVCPDSVITVYRAKQS